MICWNCKRARTRIDLRHSLLLTCALLCAGCGQAESETASAKSENAPLVGRNTDNTPPPVSNRKTAEKTTRKSRATTGPRKTPKTPVVSKAPANPKEKNPQPVFRPSDRRPKHDDTALAKRGIHRYESKRLVLYTDLDPKIARTLPPILDQAYAAWVAYFGKLPPNRERTPFQVTGYLIVDKARFNAAGLVPANLPKFVNGRHRGYRFWMYEPPWEYYRRHLMIHEATHCFMYAARDRAFPTWYMEGMAEYFGVHRRDKAGNCQFGVMPNAYQDFVGLGRIEYVQIDARKGRPLSIEDVVQRLVPRTFVDNRAYAWSWALCRFLDSHPRYQKKFRELGRVHNSRAFKREFARWIDGESPHVLAEWNLFANGFCYGYDAKSAAIDIKPGEKLAAGAAPRTTSLKTNRGWQSSGVRVDTGHTVEITATGQFELAQRPKPWVCEPQGVSITYFQGRPLGEVAAVIVPDSRKSLPITVNTLRSVPVGRRAVLVAPIKGTIYLRVNDSFAKLADNTGRLNVSLRRVK